MVSCGDTQQAEQHTGHKQYMQIGNMQTSNTSTHPIIIIVKLKVSSIARVKLNYELEPNMPAWMSSSSGSTTGYAIGCCEIPASTGNQQVQ
uniref:Uncharacterized protein n=1 Tax=Glossina pallidipes TaxID=7398 RepID=A0A1B0A0Q2_GLOPL